MQAAIEFHTQQAGEACSCTVTAPSKMTALQIATCFSLVSCLQETVSDFMQQRSYCLYPVRRGGFHVSKVLVSCDSAGVWCIDLASIAFK
eukprot:1669223-Amphidinium_carterae.1